MTLQTQPDAHTHDSGKRQRIALMLRLVGWLGFWLELLLGAASALCLVFAVSGRTFSRAVTVAPGAPAENFAQGVTPGLGIGIFWAVAGLAVLLFNLYLAFRFTRFAKRLRSANVNLHPKKADVMQVLRLGAIMGLVGMLLAILGGGASLGVLLSKAIAQPQGVAIYDPTRIIRALDIFVATANINAIAAHFLATIVSLGLFNWLNRQ